MNARLSFNSSSSRFLNVQNYPRNSILSLGNYWQVSICRNITCVQGLTELALEVKFYLDFHRVHMAMATNADHRIGSVTSRWLGEVSLRSFPGRNEGRTDRAAESSPTIGVASNSYFCGVCLVACCVESRDQHHIFTWTGWLTNFSLLRQLLSRIHGAWHKTNQEWSHTALLMSLPFVTKP